MIRPSLFLGIVLSFCVAAHADDASHRTKALQMMTLLKTQQMVQQISDKMKQQITDAADHIVGPNPTPEKQAQVTEMEKTAFKMVDDQLGWASLQAGFTDIYTGNFTEEELDAIVAFYKTPAGIALLGKMPIVNSQVTELGTSRLTGTLQPELEKLLQSFEESITAAPPTASPATAPPATATPANPPPSTPK